MDATDFEDVSMLIQNGANPNIKDNHGSTALYHVFYRYYARDEHYPGYIVVLLAAKTYANIQDDEGVSPLMLYAGYNFSQDCIDRHALAIVLKHWKETSNAFITDARLFASVPVSLLPHCPSPQSPVPSLHTLCEGIRSNNSVPFSTVVIKKAMNA